MGLDVVVRIQRNIAMHIWEEKFGDTASDHGTTRPGKTGRL